jgi:hypothetical protein
MLKRFLFAAIAVAFLCGPLAARVHATDAQNDNEAAGLQFDAGSGRYFVDISWLRLLGNDTFQGNLVSANPGLIIGKSPFANNKQRRKIAAIFSTDDNTGLDGSVRVYLKQRFVNKIFRQVARRGFSKLSFDFGYSLTMNCFTSCVTPTSNARVRTRVVASPGSFNNV